MACLEVGKYQFMELSAFGLDTHGLLEDLPARHSILAQAVRRNMAAKSFRFRFLGKPGLV